MRQRFVNDTKSGHRKLALVCVMLLGAGLLITTLAFSAESRPATTKPTELTKPCANENCHASLMNRKVVHRLVNRKIPHRPPVQNECLVCHEAVDPKNHTFKLPSKEQLCGDCHTLEHRAEVHQPVKEGKCTSCHDPHGSDHNAMLRGEPARGLCLTCHPKQAKLLKKPFVHDPVASEACVFCHEPHSAAQPKLLKRPLQKMCIGCHKKIAPKKGAILTHPPAQEGCISCHDPHASELKHQLLRQPPELCLSCHKGVKGAMTSKRVVHGALAAKNGCTDCHIMHFSKPPLTLQLHAQPAACLACHDKAIKSTDGRELTNMAALLKDNPQHHAPIRMGACTACHQGHVGDNLFLLSKAYPPAFYSPFKRELYDLCFQCHNANVVLKPEGTGLTGFRDGDKNLHFSHVNKETGRTCRACHEVHASKQPFLIRQAVAFGPNGWMLEIKYKRTPTGGSCAPGCHKPKTYDHGANPKIPAATMPAATMPATTRPATTMPATQKST